MSRRFRPRRNGFKRALTVARTGATIASAAFTGLKIAQGLAALINTEWKHHDFLTSAAPATNVGFIFNLSSIAQGSDQGQRVGDAILPKLLRLRMKITINAAASCTHCRYLIIRDMEYDAADPVIADIISAASNELSFKNMDKKRRFRILRDVSFVLRSDGLDQVLRSNDFKFNAPGRGVNTHKHWYHIRYDGPTANATDSRDGQLLLLIMSSESTNKPTFNIVTRLRYIDN